MCMEVRRVEGEGRDGRGVRKKSLEKGEGDTEKLKRSTEEKRM